MNDARIDRIRNRIVASVLGCFVAALANGAEPLRKVREIPLGAVHGRIDHLAADLAHHRLFVAELGNDSVAVVDVDGARLIHRITGLAEPQGVVYDSDHETLYVANGRDGTVRAFATDSFAETARIELGSDADNVRLDAEHRRLLVGAGDGLAVVGLDDRRVQTIALGGHPEAFRLDPDAPHAYVNVPQTHDVAVVDLDRRTVVRLPVPRAGANFPLAIDRGRLILPLRKPASLLVMDPQGAALAAEPSCEDADDAFVDASRDRLYVSCGDGHVDVFARDGASWTRSVRLATEPGARTSLFVETWDRLFLAVPASTHAAAAIWILQPT